MLKLFMVLIGCKPSGRHTEQHDVFFGLGESIKDLVPAINRFWPEVKNKFHLDGWREVTNVDGYMVKVVPRNLFAERAGMKLFFINLGGYKAGEFEEFHYKMLVAAPGKSAAVKACKQSAFFKHTGFKTAPAHIDDKYGIDVDDAYDIDDILVPADRDQFEMELTPSNTHVSADIIHLGYYPLRTLT